MLCTPTQYDRAEDVPELLSTKVPDILINLNLEMLVLECLQKMLPDFASDAHSSFINSTDSCIFRSRSPSLPSRPFHLRSVLIGRKWQNQFRLVDEFHCSYMKLQVFENCLVQTEPESSPLQNKQPFQFFFSLLCFQPFNLSLGRQHKNTGKQLPSSLALPGPKS